MKTKLSVLVFSVLFSGISKIIAQGNTYYGGGAGYNNTASTSGNFNTGVGENSLFNTTSGFGNAMFGRQAMYYSTSGSENSGIGYQSLFTLTTGTNNVGVGRSSGFGVTTGSFNTFVGPGFGTGGCGSGASLGAGSANSFLGYVWTAGDVSNTIILADGGSSTTVGTQRLYIAPNGYTGIGLGNNIIPQNRLEINSTGSVAGTSGLRFKNFTNAYFGTLTASTSNKVLTVNGSGDVILVDESAGNGGNDWHITGNAATNPSMVSGWVPALVNGTNFLGTVDAKDVVFRRNNVISGYIGELNTAFGFASLSSGNVSGGRNTVFGASAGASMTSAANSTAVGHGALGNNTTGLGNTSIGRNAGNQLVGGLNNIFIGNDCGANLIAGQGNIFIGSFGVPSTGATTTSLGNNSNNTAIIAPGGNQRLYIDGNLGFTGIGLGNNVIPKNTLEISPVAASPTEPGFQASGLRLRNLNNTTFNTATSSPAADKVLTSNSNGDVILVEDRSLYQNNGTLSGNRTVNMNNHNLIFQTGNTNNVNDGRIYIGNNVDFTSSNFPNTTGNYRLLVQGGIMAEKAKIAVRFSSEWADYVFAKDYRLMPLSEVEHFVKENSHLPGIESAEELVKNGLDLAQMQAKQMGKIEELTLYAIEQEKRIELQAKEIDELKILVHTLLEKK